MNLLYERNLAPYKERSDKEVLDFAKSLVESNNATSYQMANELSYIMRQNRRLFEAAEIARMMYESSPSLERLNLYFVAVVDQGDINRIQQLSMETEQFLRRTQTNYQKHLFATWLKAANKICDEALFNYIFDRIPEDEKRLNPYIISQYYVYLNRVGRHQEVVENYGRLAKHMQEAYYVKRYYENARRKLGFDVPRTTGYRVSNNQHTEIDPLPTAEGAAESNSGVDEKTVFLVYGGQPNMLPVIESLLRSSGVKCINLANQIKTGKTIIEAFEDHAGKSSYAIVLMTPEDEGKDGAWHPRQNVVLEYGYFFGRLGRENVCLLTHEQGRAMSIPSDLAGMYRISLDRGTWLLELREALNKVGISVSF